MAQLREALERERRTSERASESLAALRQQVVDAQREAEDHDRESARLRAELGDQSSEVSRLHEMVEHLRGTIAARDNESRSLEEAMALSRARLRDDLGDIRMAAAAPRYRSRRNDSEDGVAPDVPPVDAATRAPDGAVGGIDEPQTTDTPSAGSPSDAQASDEPPADPDVSGAPWPCDMRGILSSSPEAAVADVVVCVRDAPEDVRLCLWSVLHHTSLPIHLIVVDDDSDAPTAEFLDGLAARMPEMTLIRRDSNAEHGYGWAANAGLSSCGSPWSVLLNSDCVVSRGWLEGLIRAAREAGAAIVGPVSNAATYQSVPVPRDGTRWRVNELPRWLDVDTMSALVQRASVGELPKVPALNGFCFAISAPALRELGGFDADSFGRGYGEETDLAVRARSAGMSLVVARGAFVYHRKSRSYGSRRNGLAAEAQRTLRTKHGSEAIDALIDELERSSALERMRSDVAAALLTPQVSTSLLLEGSEILILAPGEGELERVLRNAVHALAEVGARAMRLIDPDILPELAARDGAASVCAVGIEAARATAGGRDSTSVLAARRRSDLSRTGARPPGRAPPGPQPSLGELLCRRPRTRNDQGSRCGGSDHGNACR